MIGRGGHRRHTTRQIAPKVALTVHPAQGDNGAGTDRRDDTVRQVQGTPVGASVEQDQGLRYLTAKPRKYGFHGTIKPPFRLAKGVDYAALHWATARPAQSLAPVQMPGLQFLDMGGFLALTPVDDHIALQNLAASVVADLDSLRAPLTAAEIALRHSERLTQGQRDLLMQYGYPYVMEDVHFHLTLSGPLTPSQHAILLPQARAHFAAYLPAPFGMTESSLFGEAVDGRFHLLHRYPLG